MYGLLTYLMRPARFVRRCLAVVAKVLRFPLDVGRGLVVVEEQALQVAQRWRRKLEGAVSTNSVGRS